MRVLMYAVGLASLMAVAVSCTDTCDQNKNALPRAGFYVMGGGMEKVTMQGLEVIGVGMEGDSALSEASTPKNDLYLPFRIDRDRTSYVFIEKSDGGDDLRDTVTFDYKRVPRFVSVECGVSYVFEIENITWQGVLIDSVACPDGYINNANKENLQIFFAADRQTNDKQ